MGAGGGKNKNTTPIPIKPKRESPIPALSEHNDDNESENENENENENDSEDENASPLEDSDNDQSDAESLLDEEPANRNEVPSAQAHTKTRGGSSNTISTTRSKKAVVPNGGNANSNDNENDPDQGSLYRNAIQGATSASGQNNASRTNQINALKTPTNDTNEWHPTTIAGHGSNIVYCDHCPHCEANKHKAEAERGPMPEWISKNPPSATMVISMEDYDEGAIKHKSSRYRLPGPYGYGTTPATDGIDQKRTEYAKLPMITQPGSSISTTHTPYPNYKELKRRDQYLRNMS
ncbi:unnamed protein product [Rotaria magnacalcarata]|uniref:Uncharacterized protein n=1 Tax=Rotaria magnacalcarata TaxID=392030 RepID=A0A814JTE2_9BILA|nr:unnamed protein product [Rotaria magnacalcarata]CAF3906128.1 unnamed protein product [Rotaria magnacalcarata]